MYESPIKVIQGELETQLEGEILKAVHRVSVVVDKDELIQALRYDRKQYHRHHKPVVGHKFSIGCSDGEKIVGVAIVGRPVARHLDDGWTLEVNRLCTDGTRNACSMLYAAAWRAARAMGYKRLVTYILESESGVSLKAAGWRCVGQAGGLRWTGKRRPEVDLCPAQMKIRFEKGGATCRRSRLKPTSPPLTRRASRSELPWILSDTVTARS